MRSLRWLLWDLSEAQARIDSDTVAAGNVISQSPESGTSVEKGSTVSYVVSLGPKTQTVEVPDVLRSYPETAEQMLSEAGLTAVYGGEQYSDYPKGTVCRLNPEVGVKIEKGSTVYYWVSLGPEDTGRYRRRRHRTGIRDSAGGLIRETVNRKTEKCRVRSLKELPDSTTFM